MIKTSRRFVLRQHADFFTTAQKKHSRHFILYFQPTEGVVSQAAVIVPAKKTQTAVQRNAYKRVMRSVITTALEKFDTRHRHSPSKNKALLVVLYLKKAFSLENQDLRQQLTSEVEMILQQAASMYEKK